MPKLAFSFDSDDDGVVQFSEKVKPIKKSVNTYEVEIEEVHIRKVRYQVDAATSDAAADVVSDYLDGRSKALPSMRKISDRLVSKDVADGADFRVSLAFRKLFQ